MYGVGAYKYPYRIYSEPQLPTANFRLKPPGLSGCVSCNSIGDDSNNSSKYIIGGLIVGLLVFAIFSKPKKRTNKKSNWFPVLVDISTKKEALQRSKNIKEDWPVVKVAKSPEGQGWAVYGDTRYI
jgi:hypothetical protein